MMIRLLSLLLAFASLSLPHMRRRVRRIRLWAAWKLVAADKILPDGSLVSEYGAEPHGMAIFTADGHMMIDVFRNERGKFAANDRTRGTFEEYKEAQLNSSCLFGTYSVDVAGGKVTMKIDRLTFPNYDDTTQVRDFELKGDEMSWRVPAR